ncbi:MAG: hypothetical protein ACRDID_15910 [Ktedonobacterales bacterium]
MPPTPGVAPETEQIPAASEAQPAADPTPDQAQTAEMAEEQFERQAGELRGATPQARAETEPGIEVAGSDQPSQTPSASDASAPPPVVESATPAEPPEPREAEASVEPERRAPRGRFYAPGQGPRAEHNGHNGHAANGAARRPPREPLTAYVPSPSSSAQPAKDEDEGEAPYSGPREDVRGPVGELIDALHDLFSRDRAIASQGSSSRCGICYFHFTLGELVYREAEGFYVCQACERALGGSRVSMARRQQRL